MRTFFYTPIRGFSFNAHRPQNIYENPNEKIPLQTKVMKKGSKTNYSLKFKSVE